MSSMKRWLFVAMVANFLASSVLAHTREEKIAVARDLILRIARAPENTDCIEGTGTNAAVVAVTYPTYESLFARPFREGSVGFGWSAAEKQEAFESFLLDVPALSRTNLVRGLRFYVETALTFADERQATNVLDFAKSILASPCRVGESCARQILKARVSPSVAMSAFVGMAVTNRHSSVTADYLAVDYAIKLSRGIGDLDRVILTNGVSILRQTLRGGYTARELDRLCLALYPDYQASSNRLALADWALQNQDEHPTFYEQDVRNYFGPVTNQLHQAAQPLPEVEGL